jgi:hypothetical protein
MLPENSSSAMKRAEIYLSATKQWRAHNYDNLKSAVLERIGDAIRFNAYAASS